ncbi:MAG: helix-turn-helix domain-containing protein [Rhodocyclaceae bacterium]|nr:helix-turn-helix domain-containing protein [Rhodocyclaceae bacterium]
MAGHSVPRHGAQVVQRAARLLRELATRPRTGWRLSDLAERCALDRATAHRLLQALVEERLVRQRRSDRHYFCGPMLFELGLALPDYAELQSLLKPALATLARTLRGVALFYLRSGIDAVCMARADSIAVPGLSVEVGSRRLMVTTAGGMAMLVGLDAGSRMAVLRANMEELVSGGEERRLAVLRMYRRSRRWRAGVNLADIVPGIHAFALPLCDGERRPWGALGITTAANALHATETAHALACLKDSVSALLAGCPPAFPLSFSGPTARAAGARSP